MEKREPEISADFAQGTGRSGILGGILVGYSFGTADIRPARPTPENLAKFGLFFARIPGRNYIRPPPPAPISGQKAFFTGGGWGCIF